MGENFNIVLLSINEWKEDLGHFYYDQRVHKTLSQYVKNKDATVLIDLDTFAWVPNEFAASFDDDFVVWEKENGKVLINKLESAAKSLKKLSELTCGKMCIVEDTKHKMEFLRVSTLWEPRNGVAWNQNAVESLFYWLFRQMYDIQAPCLSVALHGYIGFKAHENCLEIKTLHITEPDKELVKTLKQCDCTVDTYCYIVLNEQFLSLKDRYF